MPLFANAAAMDITPQDPQFLDGYPHVKRISTGVDTPLFASALYLENGPGKHLLISLDLLFVEKVWGNRIREELSRATGLRQEQITLCATHTHSAPSVRDGFPFYHENPERSPDPAYIERLVRITVAAGTRAAENAVPAEIAHTRARTAGLGGNRRNPDGPSQASVPVLYVRHARTRRPMALMWTVSIHPTVLHEDSPRVSGDFPGHCRARLQELLGPVPMLHCTGAAGNQSPRHVTRSNTPEEARRLGHLLAQHIAETLSVAEFDSDPLLQQRREFATPPLRRFPGVEEAAAHEKQARIHFQTLRDTRHDRAEVRTAECDWFGAIRLLQYAKLQAGGALEARTRENLFPMEIQALRIGSRSLVFWPGEVFVEFALELEREFPGTQVITYANGNSQGYLVTREAVEEGGYEASSATLLSPESPELFLEISRQLLRTFPCNPQPRHES